MNFLKPPDKYHKDFLKKLSMRKRENKQASFENKQECDSASEYGPEKIDCLEVNRSVITVSADLTKNASLATKQSGKFDPGAYKEFLRENATKIKQIRDKNES